MDELTRLRHQQLKHIADQAFLTRFARAVDLYLVVVNPDGSNLLADEEDFADGDSTGALNDQEAALDYQLVGQTKMVPCKITEDGKFSMVRHGAANEFEEERSFKCLIEEDKVPLQSVIQFELPTELDGDGVQTMTLIKVDEQPVGQLPIAGVIHIFAWFQGEI